MASAIYKASAPGKLMILGEHAVLHGRWALVCAVNRRVAVTLTPRGDNRIHIQSTLGQYSGTLQACEPQEPFQFIVTAVERLRSQLSHGFDLVVESDLTTHLGLGSSAATTVAVVAALRAYGGCVPDPKATFDDATAVVQAVQRTGSGADVAASVYGGLIAYRGDPVEIHRLASSMPLCLVYSGTKRSTTSVIDHVRQMQHAFPELYERLYDSIGQCSESAIAAVKAFQWAKVGYLLNIGQGLMEALGVSDGILSAIAHALRKEPGIMGAKISGAGLGDCVIGLGKVENPSFPYTIIPIKIEAEGVRVEITEGKSG